MKFGQPLSSRREAAGDAVLGRGGSWPCECRIDLQSLLHRVPVALVVHSTDGVVRFANPAALKFLGLTEAQMLGRDAADPEWRFMREDGSPMPRDEYPVNRVLATRAPLLDCLVGVAPAGGEAMRWAYVNAYPDTDADGSLRQVVVTFVDVTERRHAEATLRRSESSLAEAQRIAHLGSWDLDLVNDVLLWSAEIYRIFEIDPTRFGASYEAFLETIHPDDREMVNRAYTESVARRTPYDLVHRLRMKDGRIKYVHENCETFYAPDGRPLRSLGTVHDVTEARLAQERLQQLQAYLESIVQSMGEGVLTLDRNGRHAMVNPAAAGMLGYSAEELLGRDSHPLWHYARGDGTTYPPDDCPICRTLADGRTRRTDAEVFSRRDGTSFPVEYVVAPLTDGDAVTGAVVVFLDITERKAVEETIRRLNRELEDRVAARTAELEAANRELEAFAFSVSHDLRTPLRAIEGFSRILVEDYEASLDSEAKRLLGVVRENTVRMGRLIGDILDFSRMGRHALEVGDIDMVALARSVFDEQNEAASERRLRLELGALPHVRGDRSMIRQVLANLIANAVKFTRPRGEAVIELGCTSGGAEHHFFVRDNGVGFDMQYVDKLFGVFQRLHSTEEFDGTGIGLAIVKQVVTRHGGRVWAEGRLGEGATIHFTLPVEGAHR